MCGELVRQMRECGMAERDFRLAQESMMVAINSEAAQVAHATLRLAMKKREACRLALKFHERDHGCAAISASA